MSDLPLMRERIEDIIAGCEDITLGPWNWATLSNYVSVMMTSDDPFYRVQATENAYAKALAVAAYISRLDTNTVRALCALALKGLDAGEGKPAAWAKPQHPDAVPADGAVEALEAASHFIRDHYEPGIDSEYTLLQQVNAALATLKGDTP